MISIPFLQLFEGLGHKKKKKKTMYMLKHKLKNHANSFSNQLSLNWKLMEHKTLKLKTNMKKGLDVLHSSSDLQSSTWYFPKGPMISMIKRKKKV